MAAIITFLWPPFPRDPLPDDASEVALANIEETPEDAAAKERAIQDFYTLKQMLQQELQAKLNQVCRPPILPITPQPARAIVGAIPLPALHVPLGCGEVKTANRNPQGSTRRG